MTTTQILILNTAVMVGLLAALAFVMSLGYRISGSSESTGAAHWSRPLDPELVRANTDDERELSRAA